MTITGSNHSAKTSPRIEGGRGVLMQLPHSLQWMALLILMLTSNINASATVYNWSRYDLSFETPEGGFVTFNSPTRFSPMTSLST